MMAVAFAVLLAGLAAADALPAVHILTDTPSLLREEAPLSLFAADLDLPPLAAGSAGLPTGNCSCSGRGRCGRGSAGAACDCDPCAIPPPPGSRPSH